MQFKWMFSVAEETGLSLAFSETPKTGFVASRSIWYQRNNETIIKYHPKCEGTKDTSSHVTFFHDITVPEKIIQPTFKWVSCIFEMALDIIELNNVAFWQVQSQTSLCSLLLILETSNDVRSVA